MATLTPARLLGVLLLLTLVPVQRARACSRIAVRSVRNLSTLPVEGSAAPRNTKLWQIASASEVGEFALVDGRGWAVPLQRSTIAVSGEETMSLEILTPMSLLDPGAWVFSRNGVVLSHFTVTSEVDQIPPAALQATITSTAGEYFGAYSCGQPSMVTLALGAEAELAVAAPEGTAWPLSAALGVARGPTLDIAAPTSGAQRLVVFHLDLAGNATPGEALTATVPLKASGCSVATPGLPLLLMALALLRRRRAHPMVEGISIGA